MVTRKIYSVNDTTHKPRMTENLMSWIFSFYIFFLYIIIMLSIWVIMDPYVSGATSEQRHRGSGCFSTKFDLSTNFQERIHVCMDMGSMEMKCLFVCLFCFVFLFFNLSVLTLGLRSIS